MSRVYIAEEHYAPDLDWHEIDATDEPAFENSWVNYGGGTYDTAGFRIDAEGWVHLKGLIKSGSKGSVPFTLPAGYWPEVPLFFIQQCGGGFFAYVSINSTTGGLYASWYGSGSNAYLSLSGMQFPVAGAPHINRKIPLYGFSVRTGQNEQTPCIRLRDNGMAVVNGIGTTETAKTIDPTCGESYASQWTSIGKIGNSTEDVRTMYMNTPDGNSIVHTTSGFTMVDTEYNTNSIEHLWTAPSFTNSWVDYGQTSSPWVEAGYYKDQFGFVHLRGMVKSGSSATADMFTLPSGYRPAMRQIFTTVSAAGSAACRVDVTDAGVVTPISSASTTWTSLNGISFYADQ